DPLPLELRGHVLFKPEMTLEKLQLMTHEGFKLRVTRLTEEYPFDKLSEHLGGTQHMLLAISPQGLVKPFSEETNLRAGPDWRILYLEKVSDEEKAEKKKEEKAEREKKKKD